MSNINVTNSGNIVGSAIGDNAQVVAGKIVNSVRQQLPPNASKADELKAILASALEQLAKEKLEEEDRTEAEEALGKIGKEMAKPEPSKDRITRWVENVQKVSAVVGGVVRSAGAIAAMFT